MICVNIYIELLEYLQCQVHGCFGVLDNVIEGQRNFTEFRD